VNDDEFQVQYSAKSLNTETNIGRRVEKKINKVPQWAFKLNKNDLDYASLWEKRQDKLNNYCYHHPDANWQVE
jgi:hypothetical protein